MPTNSPESVHLCGIAPRQILKHTRMLFAAAGDSVLWDNGTVLDYSFFDGTPQQQGKVDEVIKEWMWYAHITFNRVADKDPSATLRITFDPYSGSWSYTGREVKACVAPEPTINFGWVNDTDTISKKERVVILHEFGHVLGLIHEHESPTRGGALRLKEREIIQYYMEHMHWDEATVHDEVLDMYSTDAVTNYSQFDPASIMIYAMPDSMNYGGVEIHAVSELSMLDKAFVVANYPRPTVHECAHQWTPQFALLAAGARVDTANAYLAAPDVEEKRRIFTDDMRDRRAREAEQVKTDEQPAVRREHPTDVQWMAGAPVLSTPGAPGAAPLSDDQLARLAALVMHPGFKPIVGGAVSVGAGDWAVAALDVWDEAALRFRERAEGVMMRMWERAGPRASERVLETIERRFQ